MYGETPITLVGNLVDDPVLRFTTSGVPVAGFRVASTSRVFDRDAGTWRDGSTIFLSCSAWRDMAHNVVATCRRGTRVMVHGRLRQRTYQTAEGVTRTVVEVDADEVGASLRSVSATLVRNSGGAVGNVRGGQGRPGSRNGTGRAPAAGTPGAAAQGDPWAPVEPTPASPGDPWSGAGRGWEQWPPLDVGDEPPF
jgi:single-strand DNA-binding protein